MCVFAVLEKTNRWSVCCVRRRRDYWRVLLYEDVLCSEGELLETLVLGNAALIPLLRS